MNPKYLKEMVHFAQHEMPSLKYDLQNASTHFALQAATQRLFNAFGYVLHTVILSAYDDLPQATPASPPQVVPSQMVPSQMVPATPILPATRLVAAAPPAPQPQLVVPGAFPQLPPPPAVEQPSCSAPVQIPGTPDVPIQPGVTNVIVTPQGTRVVAASGAVTELPPGEEVDLAAATGRPVVPEAPPGVESIVLPQGGGLTPDVMAALSRRQG
jgi:hypothetical protein